MQQVDFSPSALRKNLAARRAPSVRWLAAAQAVTRLAVRINERLSFPNGLWFMPRVKVIAPQGDDGRHRAAISSAAVSRGTAAIGIR